MGASQNRVTRHFLTHIAKTGIFALTRRNLLMQVESDGTQSDAQNGKNDCNNGKCPH